MISDKYRIRYSFYRSTLC